MQPETMRLTDDDVPLGGFCKVISGPYKGRYGVYQTVGEESEKRTAVVRTRDDLDENITVDYEHIRPDTPGKR
jgi:hypothetical protein